jgi:hypothetical protein
VNVLNVQVRIAHVDALILQLVSNMLDFL